MVRVIQTLWFESIDVVSQPFIDTPIGYITLRQTAIFGVGAAASVAVFRAIPDGLIDVFVKYALSAAPALVSALAAFRRVKTYPPESYLFRLIFPKKRRAKARTTTAPIAPGNPALKPADLGRQGSNAPAAAGAEKPTGQAIDLRSVSFANPCRADAIPEDVRRALSSFLPPLKAVALQADADGSVTVNDVLKNPKTGALLMNAKVYASIGNQATSFTTDEKGAFAVRFFAPESGSYYMQFAVQGIGAVDSILVNVNRG